MNVRRYLLHGLGVESVLPLPGLPASDRIDAVVRYGEVPEELPGARAGGVLYQAAPGCLRLALDGVARYLVTGGREIVVQRAPRADDDAVRVPLLGSAMGALLHQRGWLPLHASAIEAGGRCVAFAGASSLGKSTLAAAFHLRGYRVVTDELLAVRFDASGRPQCCPGASELKLWRDALGELAIDPAPLARERPGLDKWRLPAGAPSGPLPLSHLYELSATHENRLELAPARGPTGVAVLARATYHPRFLEGLGGRREHFRLSVAAARRIRVTRVVRPLAPTRLGELVDLVERDLGR